ENVSGGAKMYDPGVFYEMRFKFNKSEAKILRENGYDIHKDVIYSRGYLNSIGMPGSTGGDMAEYLDSFGIETDEVSSMKGWADAL
ncbi:MAG: hypothetical protein K6F99_07485, partial [Lachnospiraceae bacterium]|nr:hypothetical protein [Lachnospiraceae bacterium]